MAMLKEDLIDWLETLPECAEVGIDEGGICLLVVDNEEAYLEVGGMPDLGDDDVGLYLTL